MQSRSLGIAAAIVAASLYGSVPVLARLAFTLGIPLLETVALRTFFVAVVLTCLAVLRSESLLIPRQLRLTFAVQCASTFAVSSAYLASVQFIPVGLAVIIFFTFPVLIALAAPFLEGQRISAVNAVCIALAFAGLAVAVGPSFSSVDPRGIGLAFIAALGIVGQFHTGRILGQHMSPAAFGGLVHLAIWPLVMAAVILTMGPSFQLVLQPGSGTGTWVALSVAVLYLCGYFLQMTSVRLAPSSTVAPYFNIEPVVTTAIAVLLLGEASETSQYVGGAIVLGAIAAMSLWPRRAHA